MRILIFLGLKVVEIGGIIILPYEIGKLSFAYGLNLFPPFCKLGLWVQGIWVTLLLLFAIFGIIKCLIFIIKQNWLWAGRITKGG